MSLADFCYKAWSSGIGGIWENGQGHLYGSQEEAFFSTASRISDWSNLPFGSFAVSLVAFGVMKQSGKLISKDQTLEIVYNTPNLIASSSNFVEPWYKSAWSKFIFSFRNSVVFGLSLNPFYMAEALYSNVGSGFIGHESDKGFFLVLQLNWHVNF